MQISRTVRIAYRLIGIGLLLIFVTIAISLMPSAPPRHGLRASLTRPSQSTNGGSFAQLTVTNESDALMFYFVASAQTKSGSEWSSLPSSFSGKALPPHQSETVPVLVLDRETEWRIPVAWSVQPSGLSKVRGVLRSNLHLNEVRIHNRRSLRFVNTPETDTYWSYCLPSDSKQPDSQVLSER